MKRIRYMGLAVALLLVAGMCYMLFFKKYEESGRLTQEVKVR